MSLFFKLKKTAPSLDWTRMSVVEKSPSSGKSIQQKKFRCFKKIISLFFRLKKVLSPLAWTKIRVVKKPPPRSNPIFPWKIIGSTFLRFFTFTAALIVINCVVFFVSRGLDPSTLEATAQQILDWGGSSNRAIIDGQVWRLLTSIFVHGGFMHLFMNMVILFDIGRFFEPMIGRLYFITVYLSTGIFAGLMSYMHYLDSYVISSGASGAIFGIMGAFLVLLIIDSLSFSQTSLIHSEKVRFSCLKRVAIFIAISLLGEAKESNVDVAAHIGGLLSGIVIGLGLYPLLIFNERKKTIKPLAISLILLTTIFSSFMILKNTKGSDFFYLDELVSQATFLEKDLQDLHAQMPVLPPGTDSVLSSKIILEWQKKTLLFLETKILPEWEKALALADEASLLFPKGTKAQVRDSLVEWISLNSKKYDLLAKGIRENTDAYMKEIETLDKRLNKISKKK
jgi:rhomboid protease GluP